MAIKQLSPQVISKIAAGEVVLRPASVVKELLENSIDAGSNNISITLQSGGINCIEIIDDGYGMSYEDLQICALRHTTSKLDEDNLDEIATFGFRGEALYSISAVSELTIVSRQKGDEFAYKLELDQSDGKQTISKISADFGTKITIKNLFHTVPARLKFLKSSKAEFQECLQIIEKLALANHRISFSVSHDNKLAWKSVGSDNIEDRVRDILGTDFIDNSCRVNYTKGDIHVEGLVSIPTFNRRTSVDQIFFVNNRYVKDKNLSVLLKIAYKDVIDHTRFPIGVIFITLPYAFVDVNVHPAKTEVRFKDIDAVKSAIISGVKEALFDNSHKTSTMLAKKTLEIITNKNNYEAYYSEFEHNNKNIHHLLFNNNKGNENNDSLYERDKEFVKYNSDNLNNSNMESKLSNNDNSNFTTIFNFNKFKTTNEEAQSRMNFADEYPLGYAKCQIANTYIVAEAQEELIIVDQHAAHERLVYEKFKEQLEHKKTNSKQKLLIPEQIEISGRDADIIEQYHQYIENTGLVIELERLDTKNLVLVKEVPFYLRDYDYHQIIIDIIYELKEHPEITTINDIFEKIFETIACHSSIRAGQQLSIQEMNRILRDMEQTAFSGQCNHGRPTYIKLAKKDIEKLFGRS